MTSSRVAGSRDASRPCHQHASSRNPVRISSHCHASTPEVFHAWSRFASADRVAALARPAVHQLETMASACSACAAIVAPSLVEAGRQSGADDVLSDRIRRASPELRTKAPPPGSFGPSTSSEDSFARSGTDLVRVHGGT